MSFVFLSKGKPWVPAKAKFIKVPTVGISVGYDDTPMIKFPPAKRGAFDQTLAKLYEAKEKDTLIMAGAKVRTLLGIADAAIEKGDEKAVEATIKKAQADFTEACRDVERALVAACVGSLGAAYKTVIVGVVMPYKMESKAEVKVTGKLLVTKEGMETKEEAGGIDSEEVGKVLTGLVYPMQDEVEGVTADSKAAAGALDKSIKEANALSKAMREQAKTATPAGATLIKTMATSLHKNLALIDRLVTGSQSKLRQLKTKIAAVEQKTKELKDATITSEVKGCVATSQTLAELLSSYGSIKPITDSLLKPFDGKTMPDFGKMTTVLHRLGDPRPTKELTEHINKLGDALAGAMKE